MKNAIMTVVMSIAIAIGLSAQGDCTRVEIEFFEPEVKLVPGELLINEIQAKNTVVTDNNGEFEDWVEIYNPNDYSVDIGGMYMTDSHYSSGISAWTQIPADSPATTTIPANGYLIVWFDEDIDQGPLHINDKLGGSADSVYLIDTDGVTIIDSKSWVETDGLNVDDVSLGRMPDGGDTWQLFGAGQTNPCTPGAANTTVTNILPTISYIGYTQQTIPPTYALDIHAQVTDSDGSIVDVELVWQAGAGTNFTTMTLADEWYSAQIGPFAFGNEITYYIQAQDNDGGTTNSATYHIVVGFYAPTLYINEFMPSNTSTIADGESEYEDWVEIYNPNNFDVDLAGYYLTDDHYDFGAGTFIMDPIPDGFASLTTIPAHGFIIAWFDEDLAQGPMHIDTKLGSTTDAVYLIAPDMINVIDQVTYANIEGLSTDMSWGRYPDGSSSWQLFGVGQTLPASPGANNGGVGLDDSIAPQLVPSLSVYPNPMRNSLHLELYNTTASASVSIFNIKGQIVRTIEFDKAANWDRTDQTGQRLGNGIYVIKASSDGHNLVRKVCIVD